MLNSNLHRFPSVSTPITWDEDRGDGKGEHRLKVGISWSGDHRVVEGAELAASAFVDRREVPQRLMHVGDIDK